MKPIWKILITLVIGGLFVTPIYLIEPLNECKCNNQYAIWVHIYMHVFVIVLLFAFLEMIKRILNKYLPDK